MIMLDKLVVGLVLGFILGIIFMIGLSIMLNKKDKDE